MSNLVGQQFGNYRLMRLLGQGGFADTYLGEQMYIHTYAAIKVVQTPLAQDGQEGFFNEARLIAGLKHPNIVHLLDFGVESSRNIPYLVMDFAPNGTLRQRHRRGEQLPVFLVVSYSMQMASALQYAHDRQIIHRDVKPENMLVGGNQEILLSDFGIAVVQSSHTQPLKSVAGTMNYMAPEQIQGKPMPASDQYALAVVVYEWLCGELPFMGSPMEIAVQQQYMTPLSLRQRVATIPPAVEQVVLTALAKDPQARFESVWAFATALEQASSTVPAPFPFPSASPADLQLYIPTALASDPHLPQKHAAYRASPSVPIGQAIRTAYGQQAVSAPVPTPSGGQGPSTPLPVPDREHFYTPLPFVSESSPPRLTPQVTPLVTPDPQPFPVPQHFSQGAFASQPPPAGQYPFKPAPIQSMPSGPQRPRRPSARLIIALIAALLLLLGGGILAYTSVYQPYQLQAQATATAEARIRAHANATANARAQATATGTAMAEIYQQATSGTPVMSDPLSAPDNYGWSHYQDQGGYCDFVDGIYHHRAQAGYFEPCYASATNFTDFAYQVEVTIISGNIAGIGFRKASPDNFGAYYFSLHTDGRYEFVKRTLSADQTSYSATPLASGISPAIHRGLNQPNLVAVVARGSNFYFYVNKQYVTTATDDSYKLGSIGVFANGTNTSGAEASFRNLEVWQL